jgi:hypothetical protein
MSQAKAWPFSLPRLPPVLDDGLHPKAHGHSVGSGFHLTGLDFFQTLPAAKHDTTSWIGYS